MVTKLVVGQPITNDLSDGLVVSQTSSRQLANQISLTLTRCLSLNDDVDLKRQEHSGASNESIVQNHLNTAMLNVF